MRSWTLKKVKNREREDEKSEKQREKRWWEECDCVRLRDGEWQREKNLLIENRDGRCSSSHCVAAEGELP